MNLVLEVNTNAIAHWSRIYWLPRNLDFFTWSTFRYTYGKFSCDACRDCPCLRKTSRNRYIWLSSWILNSRDLFVYHRNRSWRYFLVPGDEDAFPCKSSCELVNCPCWRKACRTQHTRLSASSEYLDFPSYSWCQLLDEERHYFRHRPRQWSRHPHTQPALAPADHFPPLPAREAQGQEVARFPSWTRRPWRGSHGDCPRRPRDTGTNEGSTSAPGAETVRDKTSRWYISCGWCRPWRNKEQIQWQW